MTGRKALGLGRAETEQDTQHHRVMDILRQRGVETDAAGPDKTQLDARSVSDRLEERRRRCRGAAGEAKSAMFREIAGNRSIGCDKAVAA